MKQIPLAITVDPVPVFDSFVPGRNAAAVEHLRALRAPATPVYLWGEAGSGKTHLLSALAHEWHGAGGRAAWYGPGEPLPWPHDASVGIFLADNVHEFGSAEQAALFTLFCEAAAQGQPFVAAGRPPPVDLPLRDDLRTRLGWGHVFELAVLDEAETRAALRRHADQRGVMLSDDVMDYLLSHCARDLKSLVALVAELDTFGIATSRSVTVPLLKQLLAERGEPAATA